MQTINTVQPFVNAILADAMQHQDWPDDAVFKVSYRTKCWPEDFGDTFHKYFNTLEEVKYWEKDYASWARLEGNSVEYTVYQWDLGPNIVKQNWF